MGESCVEHACAEVSGEYTRKYSLARAKYFDVDNYRSESSYALFNMSEDTSVNVTDVYFGLWTVQRLTSSHLKHNETFGKVDTTNKSAGVLSYHHPDPALLHHPSL